MNPPLASVRTLSEALRALEGATSRTRVLAGGTDLMVELRNGRSDPDRVIDIWRVDELRGVREEAGGLRLGALCTCAELLRDQRVAVELDLLARACREVGAEQIQARATLGGNLGTASPAADLVPVLVALGARVRLASTRGARELELDEFLIGYRSTARRPDELIESLWVPARSPHERRAFRKVGTRSAQSISKLVVALCVTVEHGRIVALRAGAGSLSAKTVHLPTLERELVGRAPNAADLRHAAALSARDDVQPIDDVRSSASYRQWALGNVLETLLEDCLEPAP